MFYKYFGYGAIVTFLTAIILWWFYSLSILYTIALISVSLGFLRRYNSGGANTHHPLLTQKTIIITGANQGLGFEVAKYIVQLKPRTLILACITEELGKEAVEKIKNTFNVTRYMDIKSMQIDLSDLNSVKNFANKFNEQYDKLDILINNAGMFSFVRRTTVQGYEMVFGVNHLGHFLLTKLLLNKILKSEQGRIICVASTAHKIGKIHFDDLQLEKEFGGWMANSQSKLANVLFVKQLSFDLKQKGITNVKTCSLHPGYVGTSIWQVFPQTYGGIIKYLLQPLSYPFKLLYIKSVWYGAQTTLACALMPHEELQSGGYYNDCEIDQPQLNANWKADAKKLWDISEKLVKDFVDTDSSNLKLD